MKPFPDDNNVFRWFIIHDEQDSQTGKSTGETVTTYFKSEIDYERGLERYAANLVAAGSYDL